MRCAAWVITALCYSLYLHCHPEWFSLFFFLFRDVDAPIPIVKPTRCTSVSNLFILEWHCTCFGQSFLPSSGVRDCTYSNRHLSNSYCCLLASGYPLASRQQYLFDKCLLLYVQSCTPDDGRKDRPKHVECHSNINKFDTLVHLVVLL